MTQARVAAARGILRGLQALSRHVRLYGLGHPRTRAHRSATYARVRAFLPAGGVTITAVGDRLQVDSVALEQTSGEQGFLQFLRQNQRNDFSFYENLSFEELDSIVSAMATEGTKTATVRQSSDVPLRGEPKPWLSDATRVLQLLNTILQRNKDERQASEGDHALLAQQPAEDIARILHVLAKWARSESEELAISAGLELRRIPMPLLHLLREILTEMEEPRLVGDALLLRVAEQVVIRFILTKLENGDISAAEIPPLLERLGRQLVTLRSFLPEYGGEASRSGVALEIWLESLEREMWSTAPDAAKRMVLLFDSPFYVPAACIESYLERLIAHGEEPVAATILKNYGAAVDGRDAEGRKRAAKGLGEIAELYALVVPDYVPRLVKAVSRQLMRESDLRMQSSLSTALIRLSYAVQQQRDLVATAATSDAMEEIAHRRPALGMELRPRISVENRLQEFVDEALGASFVSTDMLGLLQRHAIAVTQQLCQRSLHCALHEEAARLTNLAAQLGTEARGELLRRLHTGNSEEALGAVGLLISLEPEETIAELPKRASQWVREQQDTLVRQLAIALSPQRGTALLKILPELDPLIVPGAIDEIGMSGSREVADALMAIALMEGNKPFSAYSKVKALEAVGRLRASSASDALRELLQKRKLVSWVHPREARIAALQALRVVRPEQAVVFMPKSGISERELSIGPLAVDPENPWARQRKYPRFSPAKPMTATATSRDGRSGIDITTLSLGGGRAMRQGKLEPGSDVTLQLQNATRKLKGRVLVREVIGDELTFEIADIALADRSRLRHLLMAEAAA